MQERRCLVVSVRSRVVLPEEDRVRWRTSITSLVSDVSDLRSHTGSLWSRVT